MKSKVSKIVKLVFLLFVFCFLQSAFSQSPQKMSYQAVIRDAANNLIVNSLVIMRISILQTSVTGTVVYSETDEVTTNANGLATLEIGGVNPDIGTLEDINWAAGPYYIKTETDPTGTYSGFTISGTTELLSVPYAFLSEKAVKPTNPVFVSSEINLPVVQTQRNTWIDVPNLSVTVPESGNYVITFFANEINYNNYSESDPINDGVGNVRAYANDESNLIIHSMIVVFLQFFDTQYHYIPVPVSRFRTLHLNAGDVLKVQYNQTATTPAPTTDWYMGDTGISILKVGD